MKMIYGYARVSTKEQNLERQLIELRKHVVDERNIYTDKISGKTFNRPSWKMLTGTDSTTPLLRKGDLLIVYSIDRLGRDYTEIKQQWEYITKELKADIKVLDMPLLDTSNKKDLDSNFIADLVLQILSYVAEKERINIKARQKQGLDAMPVNENGKKYSKKTGKTVGRPKAEYPNNWEEYYSKWKNKELTAVETMQILGLTKNTFYNLVKRYEK